MQRFWYSRHHPLAYLLLPLSALFALLSALRRSLYATGLRKSRTFSAPVIVVGNITVGGTGKTPLVIWLCRHLQDRGMRPGIVLRGYGGQAAQWPQAVTADADPKAVGDEAVLLARRCGVPVFAGPDRSAAVKALLDTNDCNIVLSDDGLQHYAMARDMEIIVIDGSRGLGNGFLLPAGPLRELPWRLRTADLLVSNGAWRPEVPVMQPVEPWLRPLSASVSPPSDRTLRQFKGRRVHAVAGIGNPERFFSMLRDYGLEPIVHAFSDHHDFQAADLQFADDLPVLMTEKDAVKYQPYVTTRHWVVGIDIQPDAAFTDQFDTLLKELEHG